MRVYWVKTLDGTGYAFTSEKHINEAIRDWKTGQLVSAPIEEFDLELDENNIEYFPDVLPLKVNGPHLIFSSRVKSTIEKNNLTNGQWFSVRVMSTQMWLLHSNNVVDALDESCSKIRRLRSSGKISSIETFAFSEKKIPTKGLFMVATRPYEVLCTQPFVDLVSEKGWKGFNFKPVWDKRLKPFSVFPTRAEIRERPEVYGPEGIVKGYEDAWPKEWQQIMNTENVCGEMTKTKRGFRCILQKREYGADSPQRETR